MKAGIVAPAPPADLDARILSHLVNSKLGKGYVWWAAENYKRLGGNPLSASALCKNLPEQLTTAMQAKKEIA